MVSSLRHSLLDHSEPAYRVAMKIGISEVRLSKIANGLIKPRESEKKSLASVLGKSEKDLFPGQPAKENS